MIGNFPERYPDELFYGIFLRNQTNPFRQVTKYAIGQILGIKNALDTALDKLPLTAMVLSEVLETTEQYAIRRIWQVARMYCQEKVLPTSPQLLNRAGAARHSKQPVIVDTVATALKILGQANPDCQAIKIHLPTDIDEVVELPFIDRTSRETSSLDWTQNNVPPSISPDANNKIEPSLKNSTASRPFDRTILGQTHHRRRFDFAYKLRILDKLDACTESGQKTALIEREGLYTSLVTQWRCARAGGRLIGSAPDLLSQSNT